MGSLYEDSTVWDAEITNGQKALAQAVIDFWPAEARTFADIGCGDGKITQLVAEGTGAEATCVDSSIEALKRIEYRKKIGSILDIPLDGDSIDLVMCCDVLEHLDEHEELRALSELGRIAAKYLFIAVPFEEALDEGTAKCGDCLHDYHVNWHKRSYNLERALKRIPDGWVLEAAVLSGECWSFRNPAEIALRHQLLGERAQWSSAVCPLCGSEQKIDSEVVPLSSAASIALAKYIYDEDHVPIVRSHSEILILLRRKELPSWVDAMPVAEKAQVSTGEISITDELERDLVAFPQYPRALRGVGGELIVQFPAWGGDSFEFSFESDDTESGECCIRIEDGLGELSRFSIPLSNSFVHTPDREPVAGYYGIVFYIDGVDRLRIHRLSDGSDYLLDLLTPQDNKVGYAAYPLDSFSLWVQVEKPKLFQMQTVVKSRTPLDLEEVIRELCTSSGQDLFQKEKNALLVKIQNLEAQIEALSVTDSESTLEKCKQLYRKGLG